MGEDYIYAFDKITFESKILGQIQADFNMSFVIDGTKDSAQILVLNFDETEVEPWTILYHQKTLSWWVVSHDKVERYANEDGTFIWLHNLEILGAIELLNARDLTDCGFNGNTYTVRQFIQRLFSLSSFELNFDFVDVMPSFLDKKVEFLKTYENYTLLSALREFLDAYNMCPKLEFSYTIYQEKYRILSAILKISYKTGNLNNQYDISTFNDVRETKTMDKNSFGACVVSNAENVTSSKTKTFPAVGGVRLSSKNYLIVDNTTLNDAVIRLPSKVFKANWIKLMYRVLCYVEVKSGSSTWTQQLHFYTSDYDSINKLIDDAVDFASGYISSQSVIESYENFLNSNKSLLRNQLTKVGTITIYNDVDINPITGDIQKKDNVPYVTKFRHSGTASEMVFVDKDTRECLPNKLQGIAWERGSNIISGFDFLSSTNSGFTAITVRTEDTDYMSNERVVLQFTSGSWTINISLPQDNGYTYEEIKTSTSAVPLATQIARYSFMINYYPMADIKIKVDNQRDKKDIQLYNQNGRVTDCVALSKLLNSYSKEISSDTITRYKTYYNFNDIPKVGDVVINGSFYYVINNISMNFVPNEDEEYYIECEFTMCKYVSTKSLMVNPNSNIRDYGIPQNYNVKRKQLYRDYYELAYQTYDDQTHDPYLPYTYIFSFPYETNMLADFVGIMKLTYDSAIGGDSGAGTSASDTWYYQLETTNYYLDKILCVVLDFGDNNIIGYGSQNVYSAFDVSRIFTGFTDRLNTPISYVDDNGKVKGIEIQLCNDEQIKSIYNDYQESQTGGTSYEGSLYNYSVFIPKDIYDDAEINHAITISEEYYRKDALEAPVFEYLCQIEDSEDVTIGDNILQQHENCRYMYSFVLGIEGQTIDKNTVFTTDEISYRESDNSYGVGNGCHITLLSDLASSGIYMINIRCLTYVRVYQDNTKSFGVDVNLNNYYGRDIAIFRHYYNITTGEQGTELMFIARKIPSDHIQLNGRLNLEINHYKLK